MSLGRAITYEVVFNVLFHPLQKFHLEENKSQLINSTLKTVHVGNILNLVLMIQSHC